MPEPRIDHTRSDSRTAEQRRPMPSTWLWIISAGFAFAAAASGSTQGLPPTGTPARLLFDGLTTGAILGLSLYNLALHFFVRDKGYLRFACYSLAAGLYVFSVKDYFLSFLWPSCPTIDSILSWCLIMLTIRGFIRFSQEFLQTGESLPRGHRLLNAIAALLYAGPIIGAPVIGFGLRKAGFVFNSAAALATFGVVVALALKRHRAGFDPARVYLSGNIFFCAGGVLYGLGFLGIVPPYDFFADMVVLGIVFQSAFFSMGVAERLIRMKADLNRQAMEKARFEKQLIHGQNRLLEARIAERTAELQSEKEETERLLYNILPVEVARELRRCGSAAPRRHASTSILFTDFEGFTTTVGTIPARKLVDELNRIFSAFDGIVEVCGIEKIKTIGDAYLAAAGVPHERPDHATACVRAALGMLSFIETQNRENAIKWRMRVGIHSGAVVAGVVGRRKFTYDIWGDTVNIAARLESAAQAGRINVSAYTYDLIRNDIACEYRGKIAVKGKGKIDMYHVVDVRQPAPRGDLASTAAEPPAESFSAGS
ncbi:MAG: adenylate/guanylate cyclase domain-containing protein [Pseudomonadota bacterium]